MLMRQRDRIMPASMNFDVVRGKIVNPRIWATNGVPIRMGGHHFCDQVGTHRNAGTNCIHVRNSYSINYTT